MMTDETSTITTTTIKPPRVQREELIRSMSPDDLLDLAIYQSRKLQEAKSMLRIAAKTFRWVQKPSEAQDIDKFLDNLKTIGKP
jgi:hypothetical protein